MDLPYPQNGLTFNFGGTMEKLKKEIEACGMKARGRKELIHHLEGWPLQRGQAIIAKCYDCMGYYADGKLDCLIPVCPLHGFMPYRRRTGN
jgi:hypothetical protein